MSLWLDFMGAEIRYVDLPGFGKTRIAEAGKGNPEALILMHGIGGHLEAYAKNVVELGKHYHVSVFDYVGQGLSERRADMSTRIAAADGRARETRGVFGSGQDAGGNSRGGGVPGGGVARGGEFTVQCAIGS